MSGRVGHRKRLICVTAANLRENHLYLTGHADFFPADCYGPSSRRAGGGKLLRLEVEGWVEPGDGGWIIIMRLLPVTTATDQIAA